MRKTITLLILFLIPLWSQTYLNVQYSDGSYRNTLLSSLTEITFNSSGDQINFYLTDLGLVIQNSADVHKFTFDDAAQGGILPVELISFTAKVYQNKVTLSWCTATELDNLGFEIQRYQSASGWNKIGFVKSYGTSNSAKYYSYADDPEGGTKFQYRLKQLDNNGKFSFSNTVTAIIGIPVKYELKQNYPNPFNPETKIVFNIPIDGVVSLIVYDIIGKEIASLVNESIKAGSYEVAFDGSRLASGVYFCKLKANNFTSSIKMLLIK